MNVFLTLATLFCLGSIVGWGLEVLYRRFLSSANPDRRWLNPGFCTGPWIPLYGSGLCILYLLSEAENCAVIGSAWVERILLFLSMALCLTVIEYIAGILCLKVAKIRLWDYSNNRGNIQGLICPEFSMTWGLLGVAYYYCVHSFLCRVLVKLVENTVFVFVLGLFYGVFLVDMATSAHLVAGMKAFAVEHRIIVRYEDVKLHIRRARERAGKRAYFLFAFHTDRSLAEHLKEAKEAWETRH